MKGNNMGGMGGNMAGMVQKVQAQIKQMQEEQKQRVTEVTAGGGAVKVAMNGEKYIQSLKLDLSAIGITGLEAEDVEMLEDLVSAAVNECSKRVDDDAKASMGKMMQGLGLPPGMLQ